MSSSDSSLFEKKILITGGTGFIGSHLVKRLLKERATLIVPYIDIDKNSLFKKDSLSKKTKLIYLDITKAGALDKAIKKYSIEYIIHLAAQTIVSESYKNPLKTFKTNILGTVNILETCRKSTTIKGIIIASSDKAYGKSKKKYTENTPLKGDHPYDVSKSSVDLIAQAYYKTYNTPVVITRFGNVYGEGDFHFDRIVPGICLSLLNKTPLLIRSDGKYIRDYIHVNDVVEGYVLLLKKIHNLQGNAYNFSSSDNFSVLELIKVTEKTLHVKIDYKILNNAKNEIPYQHLDDSKIRKLGWKPKYTYRKSVETIFNWYRKVRI